MTSTGMCWLVGCWWVGFVSTAPVLNAPRNFSPRSLVSTSNGVLLAPWLTRVYAVFDRTYAYELQPLAGPHGFETAWGVAFIESEGVMYVADPQAHKLLSVRISFDALRPE